MSKYYVVAIDNDYGHINGVIVCSSHETEREAKDALAVIQKKKQQSYINKNKLEKENRQRYLDWASTGTIECPNEYGGLNWTQSPGHPHHAANIESIPQHVVSQHNNKTVISSGHLRIKNNKPLVLLQEPVIPPEHYLEYHLAS